VSDPSSDASESIPSIADLDRIERDLAEIEVALSQLDEVRIESVKKSSQAASVRFARRARSGACRRPTPSEVQATSPLTNRFNRAARVWTLSAHGGSRSPGAGVRSPERRAELDEQFVIRTAEDVAKQLGEMKGVLMKAGQLVSFIFEVLPEGAQAAATLRPMRRVALSLRPLSKRARSAARACVSRLDHLPVAAASIGQSAPGRHT
jgi:hypothetical protein